MTQAEREAVHDFIVAACEAYARRTERELRANLADAFRGEFKPGETYQRGQLVISDGNTWLAVSDTTEAPSNESDAWRLFALAGRAGRARRR